MPSSPLASCPMALASIMGAAALSRSPSRPAPVGETSWVPSTSALPTSSLSRSTPSGTRTQCPGAVPPPPPPPEASTGTAKVGAAASAEAPPGSAPTPAGSPPTSSSPDRPRSSPDNTSLSASISKALTPAAEVARLVSPEPAGGACERPLPGRGPPAMAGGFAVPPLSGKPPSSRLVPTSLSAASAASSARACAVISVAVWGLPAKPAPPTTASMRPAALWRPSRSSAARSRPCCLDSASSCFSCSPLNATRPSCSLSAPLSTPTPIGTATSVSSPSGSFEPRAAASPAREALRLRGLCRSLLSAASGRGVASEGPSEASVPDRDTW
mmetsp:Transcript_25096/g.70081  ORF Transcript_25096/g.70081 Transcript_25096/m.70081 type:complete len:328 (+) Transcript_25096:3490-4473(+)